MIHWRGEPDPFKGDVPNARVREFAKEVVEVMFNATPVQNNPNTLAAQVGPSNVCAIAQHSMQPHSSALHKS